MSSKILERGTHPIPDAAQVQAGMVVARGQVITIGI
jgi:hypothetical protein